MCRSNWELRELLTFRAEAEKARRWILEAMNIVDGRGMKRTTVEIVTEWTWCCRKVPSRVMRYGVMEGISKSREILFRAGTFRKFAEVSRFKKALFLFSFGFSAVASPCASELVGC